ncbi:hypothetical protein [Deferrisoma camini]|uniref:hypothetical protein n=1 Tax=Deferrisoma camini TaxID=1035120 RepID=UPI00046D4B25|nr:hypothetical protein [Deferrisoma camini]
MKAKAKFGGRFRVECYGPDGRLKWRDTFENLVTNQGLQYLLDAGLLGGAQVGTWYVGLTDGTPTVAAGDTMTSHAGWTEVTAYSEATRPAYSGSRTNQTVSNSSSKAAFSINGTATVGGAFLASDSTKGGTTGTLLCAGAFSAGDKAVGSGDTLNVQYDFSAADDGA